MNATIMNIMPEKSAESVVLPQQQGKEVQQGGTKSADTAFAKVLKTVSGDNTPPADKEKVAQKAGQSQDENSDDSKLSGVEGILTVVPMVQLSPILIDDLGDSTNQLAVQTVENANPVLQNVPVLSTVQTALGESLTVNSDSLFPAQKQNENAVPQETGVVLNNNQEKIVSTNENSTLAVDESKKRSAPNENFLNNVLEVEKKAPAIPVQSSVSSTVGMKLSEDIPKVHYNVYGMKVVPSQQAGTAQNTLDTLPTQLTGQELNNDVTEAVIVTKPEQNKAVLPDVKSSEVIPNVMAAEKKNLTVPEAATLVSMSIQGEYEQNKSNKQLATSDSSTQSVVDLDDSLRRSVVLTDDSKMVVNDFKNIQTTNQEVNLTNLATSKPVQAGFSGLSTLSAGLVKQAGQDKMTDVLPNVSDNSTSYAQISVQFPKSDQGIGVNEAKPAPAPNVNDHYNVVSQIVEHAKLVNRTNNSEMVIQLKPEHLGELTLKVIVENGSVSTTFHSNNPDVRSVIETSLNQLRQEMSNQGLKVDYVGVYAGLSQFSSQQQREGQQQPVYKFQNKKQIVNEFGESLDAISQISTSDNADGVDYRI